MIIRIGIVGDSIVHGYYDEAGLGWFTRLGQKILEKYPGEYVTSYAHIGEDLHKSRDEVKRLLTKLKNIGEVKTTRLGNALLVSMPNYLKYQRFRTRRHKDSARHKPGTRTAGAHD